MHVMLSDSAGMTAPGKMSLKTQRKTTIRTSPVALNKDDIIFRLVTAIIFLASLLQWRQQFKINLENFSLFQDLLSGSHL